MKTEEKLTLELKEDFQVLQEGVTYTLPMYDVVEGEGLVENGDMRQIINFVRGSKDAEDHIPPHTGTLHEHLLGMMIHDLQYKNKLVPSREGALVITKLQEALGWLRQRQVERQRRGVVGTYKK